jgi:hypothetical protein
MVSIRRPRFDFSLGKFTRMILEVFIKHGSVDRYSLRLL